MHEDVSDSMKIPIGQRPALIFDTARKSNTYGSNYESHIVKRKQTMLPNIPQCIRTICVWFSIKFSDVLMLVVSC